MPVTRLLRAPAIAAALGAVLGVVLTPAATAAPTTDLTISVYGEFTPVVREYRLTCDPDGGTHPQPKAACEAIRKSPGAIKPVPPNAKCFDQVYGRERAKVTGSLFGFAVTSEFRRTDSCEEARWQAWLPVWG